MQKIPEKEDVKSRKYNGEKEEGHEMKGTWDYVGITYSILLSLD